MIANNFTPPAALDAYNDNEDHESLSESSLSPHLNLKLKRPTKKKSRYWAFFSEFDLKHHPDKKHSSICNLCATEISFKGGTGGLSNHLKFKHPTEFEVLFIVIANIQMYVVSIILQSFHDIFFAVHLSPHGVGGRPSSSTGLGNDWNPSGRFDGGVMRESSVDEAAAPIEVLVLSVVLSDSSPSSWSTLRRRGFVKLKPVTFPNSAPPFERGYNDADDLLPANIIIVVHNTYDDVMVVLSSEVVFRSPTIKWSCLSVSQSCLRAVSKCLRVSQSWS